MSDMSEAARTMGRKRTEKKAAAGRENLAKARERLADPAVSEAVNRRRSETQKARWEKYRQEKAREQEQKGAEG